VSSIQGVWPRVDVDGSSVPSRLPYRAVVVQLHRGLEVTVASPVPCDRLIKWHDFNAYRLDQRRAANQRG